MFRLFVVNIAPARIDARAEEAACTDFACESTIEGHDGMQGIALCSSIPRSCACSKRRSHCRVDCSHRTNRRSSEAHAISDLDPPATRRLH